MRSGSCVQGHGVNIGRHDVVVDAMIRYWRVTALPRGTRVTEACIVVHRGVSMLAVLNKMLVLSPVSTL